MQGLNFKSLSILVLQDHEFKNDTMRSCLEGLGFGKVATVADGRAAFEAFRFMSPDFVLTDWDLGSISGVDLIDSIRRHPLSPNRLVPIIMVTGYGSLHRVKMAADSGVNSYIVQPFDIEKLVENLERIINFPVDFIESEEYCGPVRDPSKYRRYRKTPMAAQEDAV